MIASVGAEGQPKPQHRLGHVALVFVTLHLCLDWLGQRYADVPQSITSWNPAAGLGIILVCQFGRRAAPLLMPTTLVSSLLLRDPAEPTMLAVAEGLVVGSIYTIAALVLTSSRLEFKSRLNTVKDLILLMLTAISSSLAVATAYVSILVAYGKAGLDNVVAPLLRYWIGDWIGIMIVAPFGLLALNGRLDFKPNAPRLLLLLTTSILMTVAIAYRDAGGFTYFYFLFLPVIWSALGYGIEGVVPVLALIQAGIFITVRSQNLDFLDVTHFQARMIALTATGLIAGVLVSERQRFEAHYLRQQQALAQVALRGGMGEFGAAVAHEVNQPLSAAGTFAGLVVEGLAAEKPTDPGLLENARKVVGQIDRASAVVRRLRALVKLARDDHAPISTDRILVEVAELMRPEFTRAGVELRVEIEAGLPMLFVDRLQIEQALLNLLRNALEALQSGATRPATVSLYARQIANTVELGVVDNGPGFPTLFSLERLQPFQTDKEDGLGIGLSLCQSIAFANGGELMIHKSTSGAHVAISFQLPERVGHD